MPVIAAIILLQIACAVHCVRSGGSGLWIMIILFFPVLGSLAYVVMEVLPRYGASRTVKKVKGAAVKVIDPERDLRAARAALETADTAANRTLFADTLAERGLWAEAIGHYEAGGQGARRPRPRDPAQARPGLLRGAPVRGRARAPRFAAAVGVAKRQ